MPGATGISTSGNCSMRCPTFLRPCRSPVRQSLPRIHALRGISTSCTSGCKSRIVDVALFVAAVERRGIGGIERGAFVKACR